jgi:hypothetical protein
MEKSKSSATAIRLLGEAEGRKRALTKIENPIDFSMRSKDSSMRS